MAAPRTPFLGVPEGEIRMETPDGVSFTKGDGRTMNTAYDASRPWPATLVPGDYEVTKEICDRD